MNLQKKHIIFALESFYPQHRAGTETYVLNLCKYLSKSGWTVSIIISSTNSVTTYTFDSLNVYTFPVTNLPDPLTMNGLKKPDSIKPFLELITKLNPTIVHFHNIGRAITIHHIESVKKNGIPVVFTPHLAGFFCIKGTLRLYNKTTCDGIVKHNRCMSCFIHNKGIIKPLSFLSAEFLNLLNRNTLIQTKHPAINVARNKKNEINSISKNCDLIIAIAPWIQSILNKNGLTNNVRLVKQGISDIYINNCTDKKPGSKLRIGFIGRMHPIKGYHILLKAFERINSNDIELITITFPISDETEYFNKCKSESIQHSNLQWYENLTQNQILEQYSNIDLLVVPSISEMAPLIVLESFSQHTPVLGSNIPANCDCIIPNEIGLLFESENVTDLVNKLSLLINNRESIKLMSANIEKQNSSSNIGYEMEKLYNQLLRAQ